MKSIEINKEQLLENLSRISSIKFEVTQNCNLRCKYCAYQGLYYYERKCSKKTMDIYTAESIINYIYDVIEINPTKKIHISFYGGEPLIEFTLITKIVEYSRQKFKDWDIYYALSTNGTLLNDELIDYFINNNFSLSVSLDGPKVIHDEKRIYRDGTGSFADVTNNLKKILNKNPYYYEKKVKINATYSKDMPLYKIYEFFSKSSLVKNNGIWFFFVSTIDTSYYKSYPPDIKHYINDTKKIMRKIKGKLKRQELLSNFETSFLTNIKSLRTKLEITNFNLVSGACLFGEKLYIDVEGNFHLCEKINNKFPIGNVIEGFNVNAMMKILNDFINIRKKFCRICDFRFLCLKCYIFFARNGYLTIDDNACDKIRSSIRNTLEALIMVGKYLD